MTTILIVQFCFVLLNILEAWNEATSIAMKNPQAQGYEKLNKLEHQLSASYYFAIVSIVVWLSGPDWFYLWLFPLLLLNRRIVFDTALKMFRGRSLKIIEGDQKTDTLARKVFGRRGGLRELALLSGIVVVLNFVISKI